MRRACLVLLLSAIAPPVSAHQSQISELKARVAETFSQSPTGAVAPARVTRVQSNVSYFVQGPHGSSDERLAAQAKARRQFYLQAGKECDVLLQTIASTCKLDQVNVNIQNPRLNSQQPDVFTLNGTMSFMIAPK